MSSQSLTILGISGSLRQASINRALLVAVQELAPDGIELEIYDGLRTIPPYDQDREQDFDPDVDGFRDVIRHADALLVATPEYNASVPGVLKNALDWASRPRGASALDDKPAAVVGASPGRFGAASAQAELRKILAASRARVLDAEFPVPRANEVFDDQGQLVDERVREELAIFVYGPRHVSSCCEAYPASLVGLARDLPAAA